MRPPNAKLHFVNSCTSIPQQPVSLLSRSRCQVQCSESKRVPACPLLAFSVGRCGQSSHQQKPYSRVSAMWRRHVWCMYSIVMCRRNSLNPRHLIFLIGLSSLTHALLLVFPARTRRVWRRYRNDMVVCFVIERAKTMKDQRHKHPSDSACPQFLEQPGTSLMSNLEVQFTEYPISYNNIIWLWQTRTFASVASRTRNTYRTSVLIEPRSVYRAFKQCQQCRVLVDAFLDNFAIFTNSSIRHCHVDEVEAP